MGNNRQSRYYWAIGLITGLCLFCPIAQAGELERGEALVRANCSPCHAIGLTGDSPFPDAPPFRTLSERYPIESLAKALAEGVSTGHPDMPEFVAAPNQIAAIIAYIGSLQPK